jgi:hypothetical protein
MFKVDVDSIEAYVAFDPARRPELEQMDVMIRTVAPELRRYLHRGTAPGEPGMRFKMIGYGLLEYPAKGGKLLEWPAVGIALQKNYISVYFAGKSQGKPVTEAYRDRLGALRMGDGNFSFVRFSDLKQDGLTALLRETQDLYEQDPARHRQGE